jgi:hypothetical protein
MSHKLSSSDPPNHANRQKKFPRIYTQKTTMPDIAQNASRKMGSGAELDYSSSLLWSQHLVNPPLALRLAWRLFLFLYRVLLIGPRKLSRKLRHFNFLRP